MTTYECSTISLLPARADFFAQHMVMAIVSNATGAGTIAWGFVLALAVGAFAIYLGHPGHPHQLPPRNPSPPVPHPLEDAWAVNEDLTRIGRFMARGFIRRAETVFVKDRENCEKSYATDVGFLASLRRLLS